MEKINSTLTLKDSDYMAESVFVTNNNNDSTLSEAFRERFKYKIAGTPYNLPEGFDFNDSGYFYGKVDTLGRVIIPKRESLTLVDKKFTKGETVYLNKDLYKLYLNFYEKKKIDFAISKINIDVFLHVFNIQKGAESYVTVDINYKEDIPDIIKNMYVQEIINDKTSLEDNAKNFPIYLNNILKLIEMKKFNKSILYSEYLLSSRNSMLNSGLFFEIENYVTYDDNRGKFEEYYRHPMYNRIIFHLLLEGMRFDVNAPWRYGIDFNLEATKKQIMGMSAQQYFDKNFDLAEGTLKEMQMLFQAIFISYLRLLEDFPAIIKNEQKVRICGASKLVKSTRSYSFNRDIYSQRDLDTYINKNFNTLLLQYSLILNTLFNRRRNMRPFLMELQNKINKKLDKEDLVRYTFNKMKYC